MISLESYNEINGDISKNLYYRNNNGLHLLLEALQNQCLDNPIENMISNTINGKRKLLDDDENESSIFSDTDSIEQTSNDSSTKENLRKYPKLSFSFVTRRQKKNKDRVLIVFEVFYD
jgi:hypothetical protein